MMFDKEYLIRTHIWQDDLLVIFTTDIKQSIVNRIKRYKLKETPPDEAENAAALFVNVRSTEKLNQAGWLIFNMNLIDEGTIAHECFHAASNILRHRGFQLAMENEEAFTYTQEYLINEVRRHSKKAVLKFKSRKK
jgi:hypothetical protein